MSETVSLSLGDRELSIEIGKVAKQAHGAAFLRYGDTTVLVTACSDAEPREGLSFFPLTCDYRENNYAAGKIPGGFFKREGRPTEKEILTCRLIDRPVRPLFPENFRCETQIIAMVLSAEPEVNPDVIAINGASAALYLSDIPFLNPIGAVRVGRIDGQFVTNPTYPQLETSDLNMIVVGTQEAIVMVEAMGREVKEDQIVEAIEYGHQAVRRITDSIKELGSRLNITKRTVEPVTFDPELARRVEDKATSNVEDALHTQDKAASEQKMKACRKELVEELAADDEEKGAQVKALFDQLKEKMFRRSLLEKKQRLDGRAFNKIRAISGEVSLLPRAHGSALFTRGETQALVTVTLGTGEDVQRLDDITGESSKSFMLHYNFPPFCVGEVAFLRGPSRRSIGHGVLAERAISTVLPNESDFPYTIRVVSDILESNGSSSMATVCGAVLALQDAGVPISTSIAGIAMGLVKDGDDYAILSDIAGFEDHYGDMDFKIAGSAEGITALQMDIKITGVTGKILSETLAQAKEGRLHILEKMAEAIAKPRSDISSFAPKITTMNIPVSKIGAVVGPGGKMIRSIIEETGVKIDIEDDGTIKIASSSGEAAQRAIELIKELTATAEIGKNYMGKVKKVVDFGAFVEILPRTEGLLHISEISEEHIQDIRTEVRMGDKFLVKVLNVDDQGKIRLSRRAVLQEEGGS
ncbi:MAG: polyribonucleotide nucleotidyltransferase [Acidobacteria bacterium]|nr:polyribonucleotide nucleotidyltransferase [Acidobacteriota bacterium]TDI08074.1 MAG: polyribonucleotide nucleotidyltransferase [Acidobacteriota bacterium]